MAVDSQSTAWLGLHRFGFGPKSRIPAPTTSDPRAALVSELDRIDAGPLRGEDLLTSGEAARRTEEDITRRRMARFARLREERARAQEVKGEMMAGSAMQQESGMDSDSRPERRRREVQGPNLRTKLYLAEAMARTEAALSAETGVVERLVWFWSNHFCVDARKPQVREIAGAFEREAIRPHVLGRFSEMLLAVARHPAMLRSLDQARSVGPNSAFGLPRGRGLNENFARELLELHTLGVRTVYTQKDVTELAKVLTGWTVVPPSDSKLVGGEFEFEPRSHEPGARAVVGRRYADGGVEQGRAVLRDLARHPATARHVATKLATHFVSDAPPQALVDRLAKRFLDTDGDLKQVARTLLEADEAWTDERNKIKRPSEWIVSALRAGDPERAANIDIRLLMQAQEMLGEPLWRPPSPKGFSDSGDDWINALSERLDVARMLSQRMTTTRNPVELLDEALGPLASTATRQTVARAEDRTQALALLFMSPEFQRR